MDPQTSVTLEMRRCESACGGTSGVIATKEFPIGSFPSNLHEFRACLPPLTLSNTPTSIKSMKYFDSDGEKIVLDNDDDYEAMKKHVTDSGLHRLIIEIVPGEGLPITKVAPPTTTTTTITTSTTNLTPLPASQQPVQQVKGPQKDQTSNPPVLQPAQQEKEKPSTSQQTQEKHQTPKPKKKGGQQAARKCDPDDDDDDDDDDDEKVEEGEESKEQCEKAKKIKAINRRKKDLKSKKKLLKKEARELQVKLEALTKSLQQESPNQQTGFELNREKVKLNQKLREVNLFIAETKDELNLLKHEKAILKGKPIPEFPKKWTNCNNKKGCKETPQPAPAQAVQAPPAPAEVVSTTSTNTSKDTTPTKPPPGGKHGGRKGGDAIVQYKIEFNLSQNLRKFEPKAQIVESLAIKNCGEAPWPKKTYLCDMECIFGGNIKIPSLRPGETINLSLLLKNPGRLGHYVALFQAGYHIDEDKMIYFGPHLEVEFDVVEVPVMRAAPTAPKPGGCCMMRSGLSREVYQRAERIQCKCPCNLNQIVDFVKSNMDKSDEEIIAILGSFTSKESHATGASHHHMVKNN